MTKEEWLACSDPDPMLDFVYPKSTQRQRRLLHCASCRLIWDWMRDQRSRRAVEVAERLADGLASEPEVTEATDAAQSVEYTRLAFWRPNFPLRLALECLAPHFRPSPSDEHEILQWYAQFRWSESDVANAQDINHVFWGVLSTYGDTIRFWTLDRKERQIRESQIRLIRDLYDPLVFPIQLNPNWRTSTVVELARQIYDSSDFCSMSILSDALQDAGCDEQSILDHCKNGKTHAKGCWLLDLILGKESPAVLAELRLATVFEQMHAMRTRHH
jgi:hypothetical protein